MSFKRDINLMNAYPIAAHLVEGVDALTVNQDDRVGPAITGFPLDWLGPEPEALRARLVGRSHGKAAALSLALELRYEFVEQEALALPGPAAHGDHGDRAAQAPERLHCIVVHLELAVLKTYELGGHPGTCWSHRRPEVR